jgi:hypothetical protein
MYETMTPWLGKPAHIAKRRNQPLPIRKIVSKLDASSSFHHIDS